MLKRAQTVLILLGVMSILAFANGCGSKYLRDRGNDALDMFDMGVLIPPNPKPQLGYFLDFFTITPLLYADIEVKKIGVTNRQIGILHPLDFKFKKWGYIVEGREWEQHPEYNANDPHLARNDQRHLTEPATYTTGIGGIISDKDIRPPWTQYFEVDRMGYIGWLGVHTHFRPLDIIDFVLGWTTLDIMNDDNIKPLDKVEDGG